MSTPACVLVVDDDPDIREFLMLTLMDAGYEVLLAANGQVALDFVQEHRPDVILLDMNMPVLDGWQFAEIYRQMALPHAPIIVLTAARDARQRAAEARADGFLGKPFGLDELLDLVERQVSRGPSQGAAACRPGHAA